MSAKYTVKQFFAEFASNDVCLQRIMEMRYGLRHVCDKCGKDATFHKLENRRAYSCSQCGDHVYPRVGTIFQDSRTSLQAWFYAIYLFINTRHGMSAKELERTLGVTYKTAWRMGQQIRDLMGKADGFEMLKGHVELDEAYVGGHRPGKRGRGAADKTIVMGLKERDGKLTTAVIPDVKKETLRGVVLDNVEKGAVVSTDELQLWLTHRRRLRSRRGKARPEGMDVLRLPDGRDASHEPRQKLLEAVQEVYRLDAHSRQFEVDGSLPGRFRFPVEPSADAGRDVRSSDRRSLIILAAAASKAERSIGPTPRASS